MRVFHVVPYIGEEASGPSYTIRKLNEGMASLGSVSGIVTTDSHENPPIEGDLKFIKFPRKSIPYRLGRSPEMLKWLKRQVKENNVDVIHNHSIWMMPNVYPGWVTKGTNVSLVVSPRGTFSEWAMGHSRIVKKIFWHTLQRRAIARTALFHATAESEYEDIRRLGFKQPIAVIPNGIHIPNITASKNDPDTRTLLFVSRVHPKKGVEFLLEAWAELQSTYPSWKLRIVGPGSPPYLNQLSELARSLSAERVTFEGPLYGDEKWRVYSSSNIFVLPTHSENFGMVVAEALAAGVPVITTKGAPWSGLADNRAGWWIDIGVAPLKQALQEAMSKHPGELAEMGARGRAWMEHDFAWDQIAAQMIESYRWVREGGTIPTWIRND